MSRSGISVRDVLTVGALVTAVAALANNGPPDFGAAVCTAGPAVRRPQPQPEPTEVAEVFLDPAPWRGDREPAARDRGRTSCPGGNGPAKRRERHDSAPDAAFGELKADRVTVREFVVVGDDGRERATIEVDGGNVLRFRAGSQGTDDRFALSVFPDGRAALLFKDDRGVNRLVLRIDADGEPRVTIDDQVLQPDGRKGRAAGETRHPVGEMIHPAVRR